MKALRLVLLGVFLVLLASCNPEERSEIGGLSAISIVDQQHIVITPTQGRGMYLSDAKGEHIATQLTVKERGMFKLDDRRHVFNSYQFVRVQDGKIVLRAQETFNATSLGDDVTTKKALVIVKPYRLKGKASNEPNAPDQK